MKRILLAYPALVLGTIGAFLAMGLTLVSLTKFVQLGDMNTLVVLLFSGLLYALFRWVFHYGFRHVFQGRRKRPGVWFDGVIFVGALCFAARELWVG